MKIQFLQKRIHILLTGLFLIITILFACQPSGQPAFRFVFMTDMHVQPELNADAGFRQAIDHVNTLQPDFVITGGDLIMDALGQSYERSSQQYDLYLNLCREFEMPVYHTLGNHEIFGLYGKSGIDPAHPEYGKEMFKNRLETDETYGSFDFGGWHFILLDAVGITEKRGYIGKIDSAQIQWLKTDLSGIAPETPIALSTHIPFTSVDNQMQRGGTAALSPGAVIVNSKEVLALFENHHLKLVLQGHLHIVEEINYKGTRFITGGAVSGAWWEGSFHGFPEGFVVVDVFEDDFQWQYVTFGWEAEKQ